MRRRGGRLAAAAGLVGCTAMLLAGCGTRSASGGDTSATRLGYTEHAGAVEFAAQDYGNTKGYVAPGQGLRQLVPLGDCALGVGTFANGYQYANVNWTGSDGCTAFSITPRPGTAEEDDKPYSMRSGWAGGGLQADVAVPWTNGSLIGVGGALTRRTAGGELIPLAKLPLDFNLHPEHETDDDASVNAAIRVGTRLLIGGGEYVNKVESPYLFASDDGGATVHRVELPADGEPAHTPVGGFATHGSDVVAFGAGATNAYDFHAAEGTLPFWHSADGGTHWTAGTIPATPPGTQVRSVLYASGRWYAVGGHARTGDVYNSLPLVLTSADGTHWVRADTAAMGAGEIDAATVDGAGRPVLVGTAAQHKAKPESPTVRCGNLWIGDGTASTAHWKRGGLGCGQDWPTTAVTLADGRVLIAGNRDLWTSTGPHAKSASR
ncbi:hypothetical protein [Streptomyces sp. NPDC049040]|uniref:hypothetical protein n=1 Tax=Streptomyces sp. NPDC049040 TaxID=3365593 RepID=UPI0037195457